MLCAYLDESYTADFSSIGAIIAEQDVWDSVQREFAKIVDNAVEMHGVNPDAELHGHEIMGGAGAWKPLRGKHREAAGVYQRALRVLADHDVRIVLRGLDVARLNARYKYPQLPHAAVLGHLLERVNDEAARQGVSDDSVIVLCDQVGTQIEHNEAFETSKVFGTPGYRSSRLPKLSAPLNFVDSRYTAGVQAADLVTYLYRRRSVTPAERHPAAQRTMNRLWSTVQPLIVHDLVWLP